jgi:hypothetical protein
MVIFRLMIDIETFGCIHVRVSRPMKVQHMLFTSSVGDTTMTDHHSNIFRMKMKFQCSKGFENDFYDLLPRNILI